jgi:hypothetical protein
MFTKEFEEFLKDAKIMSTLEEIEKIDLVGETIFEIFNNNKFNLKCSMVVLSHLLTVCNNIAKIEFNIDFSQVFTSEFESNLALRLKRLSESEIGDLEDTVVNTLNSLSKMGYDNDKQSIILTHCLNYILESD